MSLTNREKSRGTAVGFFMVGSVLGPALGMCGMRTGNAPLTRSIGPCIGGIVVTFASWRVIFWVQTGMVGLGLVLSLGFIPSIAPPPYATSTEKQATLHKWWEAQKNMSQMFTLMLYPNILLAVRCS